MLEGVVHSSFVSYALKLGAAGMAFIVIAAVAIVIFEAFWLRMGLVAALVVVVGGLLLIGWRVTKKERDARAGLEDLPNV